VEIDRLLVARIKPDPRPIIKQLSLPHRRFAARARGKIISDFQT